jgi:hypothetical protein
LALYEDKKVVHKSTPTAVGESLENVCGMSESSFTISLSAGVTLRTFAVVVIVRICIENSHPKRRSIQRYNISTSSINKYKNIITKQPGIHVPQPEAGIRMDSFPLKEFIEH